MWPYYPELLETPVPRYTSYPTAADFGRIPSRALDEAIEQASGVISLYLHIPFCEKICYYCGCNTGASSRRQRVKSYLSALHEEIAVVSSKLPEHVRVGRIAFGGGSPNAISASDFLGLVNSIHRHFRLKNAAWSVELDPRSMTAEWGRALGQAEITRASMGVQTFAPHCQKAIGREQSDKLICQSIDWLRTSGVTSMNFDLMYGLPHQTPDDLADSLEYTKLLGADRVAVFGYAHVPHLIPRQRIIDGQPMPERGERFTMAMQAFDYLTHSGYQAVGFDHFALPNDPLAIAARQGSLRRNFQGFTDDTSDILIGMGASSISMFPHLIAQNEKNNGRYRMLSSQASLSASTGIIRTPEDTMRAKFIEGLLCTGRANWPQPMLADIQERLQPFVAKGLATLDGGTVSVTPDGLPYARVIAAIFDPYRAKTIRRFSSAI